MNVYSRFSLSFLLNVIALVQTIAAETALFPGDDWQTATPESQGINPQTMDNALHYLATNSSGVGTDEMVIIRNGYLIWQGSKADQVHVLYSCTKTFTSTVLGLLAMDGIVDIDDYAVRYFPALVDHYPDYAGIKLSHLATMTSGYDGGMGAGWEFYSNDRARHLECVLSYTTPGPPLFLAGTSFKYHDPGVHLLGYILTKTAGESLEKIFRKRIADPIGMKHFNWSDYGCKDGVIFNNPAGTPGENQGGVYSNSLDLARYGWLYLNKGNWKGIRILDRVFVERATSTQVSAAVRTKYFDLTGRYGFYWWTNGVKADGTRPWPSAPAKTFAAHGAGRNYLFVIPEWSMVIVRLSPTPGGQVQTGGMKERVWEEFFSRLKDGIEK
ncbi:MAG: class A beta-lactamase-related serine hydrolase [Candidatus Omnitrophota bacterium]|jgi:CubicO group peptidase (beta-lactamase class C family)|nr:MAG: class A beta-lactamase-related serine hydrolase [Candidatus Omnitrophota bacterium]